MADPLDAFPNAALIDPGPHPERARILTWRIPLEDAFAFHEMAVGVVREESSPRVIPPLRHPARHDLVAAEARFAPDGDCDPERGTGHVLASVRFVPAQGRTP